MKLLLIFLSALTLPFQKKDAQKILNELQQKFELINDYEVNAEIKFDLLNAKIHDTKVKFFLRNQTN